jgi:hypothetical protein
MTGGDRLPLHIIGPTSPNSERPTVILIPIRQSAAIAPEREQRTFYPPPCIEIGLVMLTVDGCRGAVLA